MATSCYCTALRKAARRLSAIYDEALAPVGITVAQLAMLRAIQRAAPVSLTELGRMVDLDRSTVGRNAKVLERMGLVGTAAARDQREATIVVTQKAVRVLEDGAPLWDQAQAKIESALGGKDMSRLLARLDML